MIFEREDPDPRSNLVMDPGGSGLIRNTAFHIVMLMISDNFCSLKIFHIKMDALCIYEYVQYRYMYFCNNTGIQRGFRVVNYLNHISGYVTPTGFFH